MKLFSDSALSGKRLITVTIDSYTEGNYHAWVYSCDPENYDDGQTIFRHRSRDLDDLKTKALACFRAAVTGSPDGDAHAEDVYSLISEMDEDGRLAAILIEQVSANDKELESVIDKIQRDNLKTKLSTVEATVQISSISNVIAGKTYVAAIHTADAGYSLFITGETENGLPTVFHKHYSQDLNLLSREAMVLLHLSDPVHGEEFPVSNNELMNLPGNALQPVATNAARRTFAALNPKKPVTVGFSFRIDADIKDEFCKYCDERNYSYSEVLRMLMATFLQESWSQ